jgi:hypothetical protein
MHLEVCGLTWSKVLYILDFVVVYQDDCVPHNASPLSVATVFSDETLQLPWLRIRRDFPHYFFVDLYAQTRALEGFDETVFDCESFWVCHVAADVVLAGCSR